MAVVFAMKGKYLVVEQVRDCGTDTSLLLLFFVFDILAGRREADRKMQASRGEEKVERIRCRVDSMRSVL